MSFERRRKRGGMVCDGFRVSILCFMSDEGILNVERWWNSEHVWIWCIPKCFWQSSLGFRVEFSDLFSWEYHIDWINVLDKENIYPNFRQKTLFILSWMAKNFLNWNLFFEEYKFQNFVNHRDSQTFFDPRHVWRLQRFCGKFISLHT